jgi:hypothetical protein
MSYIKKKQVLGLQNDLNALQYGLPILRRETLFIGSPLEGKAILDSNTSLDISSLLINVKDNVLGNVYSQLNSYGIGDKITIQDQLSNISVFEILSIDNNVDSSFEGYFILKIQHSFGYEGAFSEGAFTYYFGRDTLSIDDKIAEESLRAQIAENQLGALIQRLNSITVRKKHVSSFQIGENESTTKTITHSINDTNVIVQIINTQTGSIHTCQSYNYTANTVEIDTQLAGNFKAIIIG